MNEKKPHELTLQDLNSPRFLRARQASDGIQHLLRDFLPQGRETRRKINDLMVAAFYESNTALINVPVEYDTLSQMEIERAMLGRADKGWKTYPIRPQANLLK